MSTKTCSRCGESKPYNQFSPHPHTRDRLQSQCHSCRAMTVRESRARRGSDREKARTRAEQQAAKWVRGRYPGVWTRLLEEAEAHIQRGLWERAS